MMKLVRGSGLRFLTMAVCLSILATRPSQAAQAVRDGLRLASQSVVPSLFPFLVCSDLFLSLQAAMPLEKLLSGMMPKLFGVPPEAAGALVLGLLGGYPSGAACICTLYSEGVLDGHSARRALRFCNNSGPGFFLGMVGAVLGSIPLAAGLYAVHLVTALLCGLLFREPYSSASVSDAEPRKQPGFSTSFASAVRKAGGACLQITMFLCAFSVIRAVLLPGLSLLPEAAGLLLSGALELSGGIAGLTEISLSLPMKAALCSFFLGFGGVCVYFQTRSLLDETGLSCPELPVCKLLHGLLAAAVTAAFFTPAISVLLILLLISGICLNFRKVRTGNPVESRV